MRDLLHEVPTVRDAELLARRFAAFGHPNRIRIVAAVACGEASTRDGLGAYLGIPSMTLWRHLEVLLKAGVLSRTGEVMPSRYALVPEALERLAGALGVAR